MARPPSALWPPSSHSSLPARHERREPALREPLHARRPVGLGDAGLEGRGRQLETLDRAQRGDGDAGILELMAPVELRRRQVERGPASS